MEYDAFSSTSTQSLEACGSCGRNFNPDALTRHAPICAKSQTKKRKVYDMAKHRSEGTDLEQMKKNERFKGGGGARKPPSQKQPPQKQAAQRNEPAPRKSNWRAQHEDFINAIRSAKGVTQALATGAPLPPPPPPTINPDYVQCEFCDRRFNITAHERHVKFCQEQHERLPNKKQPSAAAVQRANARSSYKVPKPKNKNAQGSPPSNKYEGNPNNRGNTTPAKSAGRGAHVAGPGAPRNSRGGGSSMSGSASNTDNNYGPSSGRALRTGRTAETYSQARELSAKQRTQAGPAKSPSYGGGGYGSSTHTGPTRNGPPMRNGDLGYHSSDSDLLTSKQITSRGGSGVGRFCHECGTKYAMATAKFCSECGVRRVGVM